MRRWYLSRGGKEGKHQCRYLGKECPGRGNSKYKISKEGVCLVCEEQKIDQGAGPESQEL